MSTQSVSIKTNPVHTSGQPAVFSPKQVVAFAGDTISWDNEDTTDHWPAPNTANTTGFIPFQIPPKSSSRGVLALGANIVTVVTASNAVALVFTTSGPAPATGLTVQLTYAAPKTGATPWAAAKGNFVATNLGVNSCSISLDSSAFGAFGATSGTISMAIPYTLNYVCALHPAETGSITVNPQQ